MKCLICGSGSDIARELGRRLIDDGWDVYAAPGRLMNVPSVKWDLIILAQGQLTPIGKFFDCSASEWVGGVMVNSIYPLACLRAAWPNRNEGSTVVFMGGPNMVKLSPTYTAYRAGKAVLEAIAGTLEAEYPGHRFVVLHPGVVRTKIHAQTVAAGARAANYQRVVDIANGKEQTVSHDEVYQRLKGLM